MGIENNTREIEVQNQELQRANREQIEQANKEHEELGKVLDGLDTLDNEAELDEISGNEDISEQDDTASQLDKNDKIEDEPSEQLETINNPVYNEAENNGFSINDVNQAVDAKEAYEAEIRDMNQDEYHDQKELDQRVEENGSEPNMTEPSVLGNDLHQGDVSNKETDDRSRLNEPEQNAVDMERSTEETLSNDEIDDSLSDVSTVDETNIQEVKLSELPDNVQESYRKYESDTESDTENPEDKSEDEDPEGKPDDFEAKDINDGTDNAEGSRSEISDELKESLKPFEQNERDNEFKENFEDYIRPEDDYRGYKNQPVEQDARDYAKDITSNIPRGDKSEGSNIENLSDNKTADHIRKDAQEKGAVFGKSSLPKDINNKETSFESKVREPEQYDSKYDYDNQKKLEDYYKQGDGKLTDEQKSALTDELKTNYDATSKEDRGDVRVPENEKDVSCIYYDGNTQKYDIGYNWKEDTVPESREMKVMQVGDQFDRVGPPSGKCVGEVNSDGTCATREQRSIPYHLNEANITDEPSYHRYEAEQDFTKENLDNAIDNSFYTDAQKVEMHQKVDDYYDRSHAKYGDGDGLAYGEIAPMFEDTTGSTGGGYQYDMPLSMDELENVGMISEVSRGSY